MIFEPACTYKRFAILFLLLSNTIWAQNPNGSSYLSVSYYKVHNRDFETLALNILKPLHQHMVKEGAEVAWYLYKVKLPRGSEIPYHYISVTVQGNWAQVGESAEDYLTEVHGEDAATFMDQLEESASMVNLQTYQCLGQAVSPEKKPSNFIQVNEVKTNAGAENDYVALELKYFKPFHLARAAAGIMNNWGLYKRLLPYGERFDTDYVTFNGYATWDQINLQNPPNPWKTVHGELDFDQIHRNILETRATFNNELWELIDYIVK